MLLSNSTDSLTGGVPLSVNFDGPVDFLIFIFQISFATAAVLVAGPVVIAISSTRALRLQNRLVIGRGLTSRNEATNLFAIMARFNAVCTPGVYLWGSPALREATVRTVWGRLCPRCKRRIGSWPVKGNGKGRPMKNHTDSLTGGVPLSVNFDGPVDFLIFIFQISFATAAVLVAGPVVIAISSTRALRLQNRLVIGRGLTFRNEATNLFAIMARFNAVCTPGVYLWGSPALREALNRLLAREGKWKRKTHEESLTVVMDSASTYCKDSILFATATVLVAGTVVIGIVSTRALRIQNRFIFMLNTSICDTLVGFSVYYLGLFDVQEGYPSRNGTYNVLPSLLGVNILTFLFAQFDRYFAVCHPFIYARFITRQFVIGVNVYCWVYNFAHLLARNVLPLSKAIQLYVFSIAIFQLVVLTKVVMTIKLYVIARFQVERDPPSAEKESKKESLRIVIFVVISFLVLWCPSFVNIMIRFVGGGGLKFRNEATNLFAIMARFNAVCTPAVYLWGSPALREATLKSRRPKNFPPGPFALPILGNILQLTLENPLKDLERLRKTYGSVYCLFLGPKPAVVINGTKAMKEAMVIKATDFAGRPQDLFVNDVSQRKGVILVDYGPSWREHRRFALMTLRNFGLGKNSMEERIHGEIGYIAKTLESSIGKTLSPQLMFHNMASNIICQVLFGRRYEYDDEFIKTILYDSLPIIRKLPLPFMKAFKNAETCQKLIKSVLAEHKNTRVPGKPRDFLDCYLDELDKRVDDGSSFSEHQLIMYALDIHFAGTDTTSNTLLTGFLYLAAYPHIQERCQQEIDQVLGGKQQASFDDRHNMPYVQAVIHEIQRVANTVPLSVFHTTTKDTELMGYSIPKGTLIIPNLTSVLNEEGQWKFPHEFNPENFLNDKGEFVKPEAFLPFSAGTRVCLGEGLARMELFLVIVTLLREFKFIWPEDAGEPDFTPVYGVTLTPKPYSMKIQLRQT
ncbi:hypothetical protein INR49_017281 [Caranx melampygus]|nr:hypothetical protein INR49_017281 [Caranx melampygus]